MYAALGRVPHFERVPPSVLVIVASFGKGCTRRQDESPVPPSVLVTVANFGEDDFMRRQDEIHILKGYN